MVSGWIIAPPFYQYDRRHPYYTFLPVPVKRGFRFERLKPL